MTQPDGMNGICAVVLAAGRGERFGGSKLLAAFQGAPLLAHPLGVLVAARGDGLIERTVVVVPSTVSALHDLARSAGAEVVLQPDPRAEQEMSLRLGLRAATGAAAALIVLGDQPLLRLEVVAAIVATGRRDRNAIVRPRYADRPEAPGHPVLVPARWWHLAESPRGFRAAEQAGASVHLVPLAGANPDVDTVDDLHVLESRTG